MFLEENAITKQHMNGRAGKHKRERERKSFPTRVSKQEMKIMEWEGDKGPFFGKSKEKKRWSKKKNKRESEDDKMCAESIYLKKPDTERE